MALVKAVSDQYPGRLLNVRLYKGQNIRKHHMDIDVLLLRLEGDRLYRLVDDRRRIRRLQFQLDITRLHLRHIQQFPRDLQQPRRRRHRLYSGSVPAAHYSTPQHADLLVTAH